ncbi:ArsR family transcriptional regulator [archaeon]|jgi:predicted transcriptional regulator|nr:ArsR family transcriptional regulator [archaeon]MBT6698080.1 ArsR family transcriptional regulator [archaeon]
MSSRITIIRVRRDNSANVNDMLQWIGNSLGLFSLRDKNKSCFRIFIVLLKRAKRGEVVSSDDIALLLGLSRGTVVHHLNSLMDSGIVLREQGGYILRATTLEGVVEYIKRDIEATMDHLSEMAKEVDLHM